MPSRLQLLVLLLLPLSLLSFAFQSVTMRRILRPVTAGQATRSTAEPLVSATFDAGNIAVTNVEADGEETVFRLAITPDPFTHGTDKRSHMQWFYFRASNVASRSCRFVIENIHDCSYAAGFENYSVVASYDRDEWFRVPASLRTTRAFQPMLRYNSDAVTAAGGKMKDTPDNEETHLEWSMEPEQASVWFAYFTPYDFERHMRVVAELAALPAFEHVVIGETLDGRPMDMLVAGRGPLNLWVCARQHPGESMAEWHAEGFLRRLADPHDPKAKELMEMATVRVVPNMNPDGSVRGHLRTNAAGANLNREWWGGVYDDYEAPSAERSPEVLAVMRQLEEVGCDAYVDVHGDEIIEANFFAGSEGVPSWNEDMQRVLDHFSEAYVKASPDFQIGLGYSKDRPGEANLSVCSNAIAEKFGCLAVTLEMPFKDASSIRDERYGWSGPRSMHLGAALVDAFLDSKELLQTQEKR